MRAPSLVLITLLTACPAPDEGPRGRRPVAVAVAPITRGDLSVRRSLPGRLRPGAEIVVATSVPGRVERLPFHLGDAAPRGAVVAVLDRVDLAQAAAQARANVEVGEAEVAQARVRAGQAAEALARAQVLAAAGAASQEALDAATATAASQAAALRLAEASLAAARAGSHAAEARAADAVLTARWPGDDDHLTVARRDVDEGTWVAAGTPLLTLVDLDPLRADVFVTADEHGAVQPGAEVVLTVPEVSDARFPATATRAAPVLDPSSGQARVELSVPNPDGQLVPGQVVRAEVVVATLTDVALVPEPALTRRTGGDAVFVREPGASSVRLRPVQVLGRDGDQVAVSGDGLDGDVVVLGHQLLDDGAEVVVPDGAP